MGLQLLEKVRQQMRFLVHVKAIRDASKLNLLAAPRADKGVGDVVDYGEPIPENLELHEQVVNGVKQNGRPREDRQDDERQGDHDRICKAQPRGGRPRTNYQRVYNKLLFVEWNRRSQCAHVHLLPHATKILRRVSDLPDDGFQDLGRLVHIVVVNVQGGHETHRMRGEGVHQEAEFSASLSDW